MSNSYSQFNSWNRRPRSDLRFFADLEEENNRSFHRSRPSAHFKPYDRSERFSHPKHQQRDYVSGRNRFSSESHNKYNNNSSSGSSSNRNDHAIDPIRRHVSDEPFPARSASSVVKSMSRSFRSVSRSVDDAHRRACSPFRGGDENAGHDSFHQTSGGSDNDSSHAKKMKDKNSSLMCARSQSRDTSEDRPAPGRTSSIGCRSRRDSGEACGSSHRLGSESSASSSSFCLSLHVSEKRTHSEGNIDLVHMTKQEDEAGDRIPAAVPPAAATTAAPSPATCNSGDTHLNRYDAASISTITSAEFSHQEDMDISENEGDDSCSDGDDFSRSGRRSRNAWSQTSDWNKRTRVFGQRRSESNQSDSVFQDSGSPRKFTSRAYQAYCDNKRNGYSSDVRSERSRSFSSRSSPPLPFRRTNYHISPRLYDFDDYGIPDRDERINRTLYLGSLDPTLDEHQIREMFEPFGDIKSVFVKKVDPSRKTTYGFVKMANLLQAFRARAALNGQRLGCLKLVIRYGKTYPTSRVWLGNLSPDADSTLLHHELDRFGVVRRMIHFKAEGEALVDFESIPGAVEAKNGMMGVILGPNGVTRSSSLSSSSSPTSRPVSSSASTPSPTPPSHPPSSSSSAHPLHSVPTPLPATASPAAAIIPGCKGIVTDFDDHEAALLSVSGLTVQSTFFDNPPPPDSSFSSSNQPFSSRTSFFSLLLLLSLS